MSDGTNKTKKSLHVALVGSATAEDADLVTCEHASMDFKHGDTTNTNPVKVIYYDQTSEHHLARQAVRNGEWVRDSRVVAGARGEAPKWHLIDSGGKKVVMHSATAFGQLSDAATQNDWQLTTVYDKFDAAGSASISNGLSGSGNVTAAGVLANLLDANLGVHVLGVRTRERVVPPGTQLTAIGEVYIDGDSMRFSKPAYGHSVASGSQTEKSSSNQKGNNKKHFVVTNKAFDEFVSGFGRAGQIFEIVGTGCATVGFALVVAKLFCARRVRRRESLFRERLAEAEAARLADPAGSPHTNLSPGETCVVCLYARATACYKECGHLVCCEVCAARMTRCPLCRRQSAWMKVFRAGG